MAVFYEELVLGSFTRAGLVFINPSDLLFDDRRIFRDIFIPVSERFFRERPQVFRMRNMRMGFEGISLPVFIDRVLSIERRFSDERVGFRIVNNNVIPVFPGTYDIYYSTKPVYSSMLKRHSLGSLKEGESTFFQLPFSMKPGASLTLSLFETEDVLILPVDDNVIRHDLSVGKVDISLSSLSILPAVSGALLLTVETLNPFLVNEIDNKQLFYAMFAQVFLSAVAAAKSLYVVEGFPVDISRDDLMSRSREMKEEVDVLLANNKAWWRW